MTGLLVEVNEIQAAVGAGALKMLQENARRGGMATLALEKAH